jgi:FKBP-type peptidyl-prolyl cis-trans isomerase
MIHADQGHEIRDQNHRRHARHRTGTEKGDRVRIRRDLQLNRGDFLSKDQENVVTIADRNIIAGFMYGLEGMREGDTRKFRASPPLCFRDVELEGIPKNAVFIYDIEHVEIVT